jgi:hypothetical protein
MTRCLYLEDENMDKKISIKLYIKWILFCMLTFGLLSACVDSSDTGSGVESISETPGDIEDTVSTDRNDEVVKSAYDDSNTADEGVFDWEPKPEDVNLETGEAFINATDILTMESYPPQFAVMVSGAMPTPCHELRVEVSEPDQKNQIHVKIYSINDPSKMCIQVLESFETNVPLGTPPPGTYQVILNGDEIGEIGYE